MKENILIHLFDHYQVLSEEFNNSKEDK